MMDRPSRPRRLAPQLTAALLALGLAGCESLHVTGAKPDGEIATGTALVQPGVGPVASGSPDEPKDDVTLGKEQFRAQNYGLAELHFRKAAEAKPGDAEAWLGLAASYDQLRRFRLADRAYRQAFRLTGPTPEFLNNRGYSFMLRGDVARASADLAEAGSKDPDSERIQNNLKALDAKARRRI